MLHLPPVSKEAEKFFKSRQMKRENKLKYFLADCENCFTFAARFEGAEAFRERFEQMAVRKIVKFFLRIKKSDLHLHPQSEQRFGW